MKHPSYPSGHSSSSPTAAIYVHIITIKYNTHNYNTLKYVTRFGKTCIVHTSDFEYLEIYKNHNEWFTELKVLGKIEE